jgi:hypothetical protein
MRSGWEESMEKKKGPRASKFKKQRRKSKFRFI